MIAAAIRNPLITLLIAISLVSLISVGMLMAMRIGFNTQEKTNQHLYDNRRLVAMGAVLVFIGQFVAA